jgi:hypothetical protein
LRRNKIRLDSEAPLLPLEQESWNFQAKNFLRAAMQKTKADAGHKYCLAMETEDFLPMNSCAETDRFREIDHLAFVRSNQPFLKPLPIL